ncbi:isopenicillin N synthase family dioxygenase [Mangrovimicrobium sediminis]|nr:isopenicillin N synthase family oxygenase [Haliea sp. SAOS-164]
MDDSRINIIELKSGQRNSRAARAVSRSPLPGEIPLIDVSPIYTPGNTEGLARTGRAIAEACQRIGFFYATGHSVAPLIVDNAFSAARTFFALPLEERLRIKLNDRHRGYMPMGDTTVPGYAANLHHSFEMALDLPVQDPDVLAGKPLHASNVWPELAGFRDAVEACYDAGCRFGFHLLRAMASSLDLPDSYFQALYRDKPLASMRLLHYPPSPDPVDAQDDFGIAPHSDYGVLTLLLQDETGGLELLTRGGEWIQAPHVPGAYVVNIGDLMGIWTNDRYTSMQHRVRNTGERDRYSIPLFYNPSFDTRIACLPGCATSTQPAKYAPERMGEYLLANFNRVWESYKRPTPGD